MYEIIMLKLSKDKTASLICNSSQVSEVIDFVKGEKGSVPDFIIDMIEANFDCKEAECSYEDPYDLKKQELPESSQKFLVYIDYNNGSEPSMFGYPTLEHARIVGNQFITKDGSVKIYERDDNTLWGALKLVENVTYKGDK